MESSTQVLRRLLDERGVEYKVSVENGTGFEHVTWHPNKFSQWTWNEEFGAGWLAGWQQGVTPEQAIAATLGRESYGKDAEQVIRAKSCEQESNTALKAENEKLRELVRDMWREGAFEPGACYVYEADRLEERTRELGIEVGE